MRRTRVVILNIILVLIILGVLAYFGRHQILDLWDRWMIEDKLPEPVTQEEIKNIVINKNFNINVNIEPEPIIIPDEFNLEVPFTTQAPYANWDEQHNESCEEAAALIVHYWWQDKTFTKDIAEEELQNLVDFQIDHYGKYKDTDSEETAQLIRDIWGYKKVEVKYDINMDDIKEEVAQGRPVIIPTAGRELGNPNFRSPGPLYHMLVVRGWTTDMIITNDPGTRKGENYMYAPDVLYNAIHDWNDGDIYNGQKAMIVIWPK